MAGQQNLLCLYIQFIVYYTIHGRSPSEFSPDLLFTTAIVSLVLLEVIDFDNPLIFLLLTCFYLCHFYFITIPSLYQKKDLLFQIENVALIIPPHPTLPSSVIGSYVSFCLQSLILIGFSWHTYDAIVPNLQTYDDSLQADKLGHNIHCFLKLFRAAKTMDAYPFTHPIHL